MSIRAASSVGENGFTTLIYLNPPFNSNRNYAAPIGCRMFFPFRNFTVDHIVPLSKAGTDHDA